MLTPLLLVLALFVFSTVLPMIVGFFTSKSSLKEFLHWDVGARDQPLGEGVLIKRAARALDNLKESLFVFLPLALLHLGWQTSSELAQNGAWLYLAARLLYAPAYLSGIPGLRSLFWAASWAGLLLLLVELPANGPLDGFS